MDARNTFIILTFKNNSLAEDDAVLQVLVIISIADFTETVPDPHKKLRLLIWITLEGIKSPFYIVIRELEIEKKYYATKNTSINTFDIQAPSFV